MIRDGGHERVPGEKGGGDRWDTEGEGHFPDDISRSPLDEHSHEGGGSDNHEAVVCCQNRVKMEQINKDRHRQDAPSASHEPDNRAHEEKGNVWNEEHREIVKG